jgi:oligopeptide/dipeptide ABC transporter ATP-binding protein
LVGESGSGKSTAALSLMRLLPRPAGRITRGRALLDGKDLFSLSDDEMRRVRGNEISMTFQDPMTYLNPVMRVGDQIVEGILQHQPVGRAEARRIALEWITNVLITEPARVFDSYPFQLSGGMRQRILIAIALACRPSLLVADEPTTALDVTIQREILDLVQSIRKRFGTAILIVTHDLGVVSELCDRVYVMYAGHILEHGEVRKVLRDPQNPYTRALLRSAKSIDEFHEKLYTIDGSVPSLIDPPKGCRFRTRCPLVFEKCVEEPPLFTTPSGSQSKCWLSA